MCVRTLLKNSGEFELTKCGEVNRNREPASCFPMSVTFLIKALGNLYFNFQRTPHLKIRDDSSDAPTENEVRVVMREIALEATEEA